MAGPRVCCGCSSAAEVQYVSAVEVAVQCGSSLCLLALHSGQQRVLGSSTWQGVHGFASSVKAGVLAVALQGYQPVINVFSTQDLQQQASVAAGASFGYTAVALSHDGELLAACADSPDLELSVWHWRKSVKLASAKLQAPISKISFHPADNSILLTTSAQAAGAGAGDSAICSSDGSGAGHAQPGHAGSSSAVLLWQLHKLWEKHELQCTPLQPPSLCQPTCHAWAPEGVYVGCCNGSVFCISPETGAVIGKASPQAVAAAAGSRCGADAVEGPAAAAPATACISSIAVNKLWLAVACSNCPNLSFYQRCSSSGSMQQAEELQPLGSAQVSSVGCGGVAYGGSAHASLVVSTMDGSLLLLSPGSQFDPTQPDPAGLQVEPLADWHVGAVSGVAAAATGAHIISCGMDGSIRVWAAAAGGQLVSKRDVGGQLTCSAASTAADASLLAVGSKAGVLRIVNASDLVTLPVVYHSRLFKAAVTAVAFSPCGTYLAAAAASTGRVALLKVTAAGQQVQLLGYVKAEGSIKSLCWLAHTGHQQPQLLLSLSSGKLLLLSPPVRPAHVNLTQLVAAGTNSDAAAASQAALDLSYADVHGVVLSAPAPLQAMAVLPVDAGSGARSRTGSTAGACSNANSPQILAAGCNGQLFWLQLPPEAMAAPAKAAAQQVVVAAKALLPWPAASLAVSRNGQEVLVAAEGGAVLQLPAAPAAATSMLNAAGLGTVSGPSTASGADGVPLAALAWSADASWAAAARSDGSLVVYATGTDGLLGIAAAAALPSAAASVPDCDAADDTQAHTAAEAEAARAEQEAQTAAESVRAATMQRLDNLKRRLEQALKANAAAPEDQQLSEAELVLNSQLLQQLRGSVNAEEAQLLLEAPRKSREQEVQAKRLKTLCWDALEVKRAVCTGLRSADPQVWNFQLPVQDESEWAQVAEQRREQLLAANKHILDQDSYARSAASSTAAGGAPAPGSASGAAGSGDGSSNSGRNSDGGNHVLSSAASMSTVADGIGPSQQAIEHLALLTRVKACSDARKCDPADLLFPELGVTSPETKLMQAAMYKRMALELKTQFNKDFDALVKQKHTDADRLSDLNTRVDELIRELVKIHLVLNPAAAAAAAAVADTAADADAAAPPGPEGRSSTSGAADGAAAGPDSGAAAADGRGDVMSAAQLTAELAAGRLVPYWGPEENLEDMLLKIQPGEVKAAKYLTPAERAKADAEEAAADAARKAAAADSSRARALQQMMGGRLERSVDEVSELVTSRPAWMVSGDPSTFNEEQLKEYKEYMAKQAAAIEERLKRKGIMETELRTLKAAAEEVASKFDAAVAALAAKRLDVLAEVTALETRMLQLQADEEVATVTAGPDAQAAAAHELQQAREALAVVERELALTQHLHDQQQEALIALHAEEKATDRAFKRDFGHVDPLVLPYLSAMYKNRIVPLDQGAVSGQHSTAAAGHAHPPSVRAGSASRGSMRMRAGQSAGSPRASKIGTAGVQSHLGSPRQDTAPGQGTAAASAELTFTPLSLAAGKGAGPAAAGQVSAGSGSGAHGRGVAAGALSAAQQDLCGPLGPAEYGVVQLYDDQMPEGMDDMLWVRFVELHHARAQLDLVVREQTAKVLSLKRQLQLLLQRHAERSEDVAAAADVLDGLRRRQHRALHDVEVQLKLKQGQVEVWPSGMSCIAPEALLVERQEVKGLNKIILTKGEAKLDMLRKMKEFKRGIHQLHWENKKCEMEAEDVTSLTQQLQLLHVTKEFQQQVKAGANNSSSNSSSGRPGTTSAGTQGRAAAGAGAAGVSAAAASASAAASKEVASLENLLKVRETLHANAVEQKKRQLRSVEAQLAAKRNENATLALHLAGLERLLDEAARLRSSTAADDATSVADCKARTLAMQAKLRDIAEAQAAEIAAAERELQSWQQRCFPCLPALPGEDDQQPSGGADQAQGSSSRGAGSCILPDIKGATGSTGQLVQPGGFVPHGARGHVALAGAGSSSAGMFGVRKGPKAYVGPDGKPGVLGRG